MKDARGKKLYSIEEQTTYQKKITGFDKIQLLPFRSLPFIAVFFVPFTSVPLLKSFLIFSLINVVILLIFIIIAKEVFIKIPKLGILGALVFLYLPNIRTILLGQLSLFLSLIALCMYVLLKSKKNYICGILCGLMIIKMQYIGISPFLLLVSGNKRKFILGLLTSWIILGLVSFYIIDFGNFLHYPSFLLMTENSSFGSGHWHLFTFYSILKSLPFLNNLNIVYLLLLNTFFYLAAFVIFAKRTNTIGLDLSYALILLITVFFSVHSYSPDLAILMTSILILLNLASQLKDKHRKFVLLQAVVLFSLVFFLAISELIHIKFNFGAVLLGLGITSFLFPNSFVKYTPKKV